MKERPLLVDIMTDITLTTGCALLMLMGLRLKKLDGTNGNPWEMRTAALKRHPFAHREGKFYLNWKRD